MLRCSTGFACSIVASPRSVALRNRGQDTIPLALTGSASVRQHAPRQYVLRNRRGVNPRAHVSTRIGLEEMRLKNLHMAMICPKPPCPTTDAKQKDGSKCLLLTLTITPCCLMFAGMDGIFRIRACTGTATRSAQADGVQLLLEPPAPRRPSNREHHA